MFYGEPPSSYQEKDPKRRILSTRKTKGCSKPVTAPLKKSDNSSLALDTKVVHSMELMLTAPSSEAGVFFFILISVYVDFI